MSATNGQAAPPPYPARMDELIKRAASLFCATWPSTLREFAWAAQDSPSGSYIGRLDLGWHQHSMRVVIREAAESAFMCKSLGGELDMLDESDSMKFTMGCDEASCSSLVFVGAEILNSHWLAPVVSFDWWEDGSKVGYVAKLVWTADMSAPKIIVCEARSGLFRCQSLSGQLFDIDPSTFDVDAATDEAERLSWQQPGHKVPS